MTSELLTPAERKALQKAAFNTWATRQNNSHERHLELEAVRSETREVAAKTLDVTDAELRLMAGEMDTDTMLTVQAVLKGMQFRIRNPRA